MKKVITLLLTLLMVLPLAACGNGEDTTTVNKDTPSVKDEIPEKT